MGELICPNCGSKVKLPETSSFAMGMTFSKECNGTHYLHMEENNMSTTTNTTNNTTNVKENKTMTKQEQMIELLKANGFSMEDFFNASETKDVSDKVGNDPIANKIMSDGDVFNSKLDGRWIMAQMFEMLDFDTYGFDYYNDSLNRRGYAYQWEMLASISNGKVTGELHRLANRERDGEDLSIKSVYFNNNLVANMIRDYVEKLKKYIDKLPTYYCKRTLEYKRLGNNFEFLTGKKHGDIFVEDLHKVYSYYYRYASKARYAKSYKELLNITMEFKRHMIHLNYYTKMSQDFKDAYKGNGAYYTLYNLINFHGCRIGEKSKAESLDYIKERALEGCGWKLLGLLKETISYNDFDFEERMNQLYNN